MHLKAFEVRNYRAFVEPARVELRPLTLLFGYNNAGKSALARVLPLLRDSVGEGADLPLNLESKAVRGAEFADLRSKQTKRRTIELTLEWDEGEEVRRFHLVLQDLPDLRQHVIESFEIEGPRGLVKGTLVLSPNIDGETIYDLQHVPGWDVRIPIEWNGLIPRPDDDEQDEEVVVEMFLLFRDLEEALLNLRDVLWIGGIRSTQPREAKFPRTRPDTIGPAGIEAGHILAWDKQHGDGEIFSCVSNWYGTYARIFLDVSQRADTYALVTGLHQVNLSDTGEGHTQVLPVLVSGAMVAHRARRDKGGCLAIEQPELHLHPALHAPLAEFFCEIAAADKPPQMLIETHSENFLFGVQLAIANGQLDPSRVIIYWVQQDAEGNSTLSPIQLDADGRPDSWPPGVFMEETELARKLIEARRQRKTP